MAYDSDSEHSARSWEIERRRAPARELEEPTDGEELAQVRSSRFCVQTFLDLLPRCGHALNEVLPSRASSPFGVLLDNLIKLGQLCDPIAERAVSASLKHGATWAELPNGSWPLEIFLEGLVRRRALESPLGPALLRLVAGAHWETEIAALRGSPFDSDFIYCKLLNTVLDEQLADETVYVQLLERSLVDQVHPRPMSVRFEGGGSMFQRLVSEAVDHGVLGTPAGDLLMDMGQRYGGDWQLRDGWDDCALEELLRQTLRIERPPVASSVEACLCYLRRLLDSEPEPGRLWNGELAESTHRSEANQSTFFKLLEGIARQWPSGLELLHLAERTGGRWEAIAWNQPPNFGLRRVGALTPFHQLVQALGTAGAFRDPGAVDFVARALEAGADWQVDDPELPGPARFRVNIPKLVWRTRRETVRLIALSALGRAELPAPSGDDEEAQVAASCVVFLARLVAAAKPASWSVHHPLVSLVFSFLPRVPPMLGYDFEASFPGTRGTRERYRQRPR